MKKLLGLLCAGAVMAMMAGCGITGPVSAPKVTIDNAIGSIAIPTSNSVTKAVTGKISGDTAISAVTYSVTKAGGAAATGVTVSGTAAPTNGDKSLDFTATITISSTADSGAYQLKISATAGPTTDVSFDFTLTGGSVGLTVKGTGKIANIMGPDTGSYDLVNSVRVSASSSDGTKDLMDMSLAGQGFAGSLTSGNGGTFASATATDYSNATATSVKALAANATASSISIAAGTVFVEKLGNSRGYAIVKILTYDPNAGASTGGNTGEATFEYKFTAN